MLHTVCLAASSPVHCKRGVTRALAGCDLIKALIRCGLGCVTLIGLLLPAVAGSTALAEPDARAVRQVVEAQLEAFAVDDATLAFSFASPSIQAQFGDPANFMAMVKGSYPMVVRPAAVSFFQAQFDVGSPSTVTQPVQLRDRGGRLWKATYLLERQAGAGWRISGCAVAPDSGKSST